MRCAVDVQRGMIERNAGVLAGEVEDIVLVDVTPHTLGIEMLGAVATPLIRATRRRP